MKKNILGILLNSKNRKMFVILFPLFIMATVVLFFQNCAKNFQVTDLSSKSVVAAESDPSLLQGKFIEVHADPVEPTSEKVSFFILQKENGELFLLDKNNYHPGSFDAIKRNSSVTIHLSNESIGAVLLAKKQMTKTSSTFGALKPEQVASMGPPPLIRIKGFAIYQNLPKESNSIVKDLFAEPKLSNKLTGSGDADLNVAVVTIQFKNTSGANLREAAGATDAAVKQMNKNSYNKIRMHFNPDEDAYVLDNSNFPYEQCVNWVAYSQQAIQYAVAQANIKGKIYNRVVAIIPFGLQSDGCNWSGITYGGRYDDPSIPNLAVKGPTVGVIAHELGHTLDLGHSGAKNAASPYADNHDVMGTGFGFNGAKLMDLNIFKLHAGLEFVTEGNGNIVEIYSKDKDPALVPPNKPYLYSCA